jgi:uncharacterized membrane protein
LAFKVQNLSDRPKIKLKRGLWDFLLEGLGFLLLLLLFGLPAYYYPQLPEMMPTHYNALGEADAWGSKDIVWLMPFLGLTSAVTMIGLAYYPEIHNYPFEITEANAPRLYLNSRRLLQCTHLGLLLVFLLITWKSIAGGLSGTQHLGMLTIPLILIFSLVAPLVFFLRAFTLR